MTTRDKSLFGDPASLRRQLSAMSRRIRKFHEDDIPRRYFSTLGRPRAEACTLAWFHVEQYLAAARQQVHRIERGRRAIEQQFERARKDDRVAKFSARRAPGNNMWADAHFYFICWHMIGCLLRHIDQLCQLRRLKRFMRMKRTVIDRYINARDHLEHWVERLPGGPKAHVLHRPQGTSPEPRAPGGYYFGLGGKNWDMSKASLRDLTSVVHGFRRTLIEAARAGEALG